MNCLVIDIPERLDINNLGDMKKKVRAAFDSDATRIIFNFEHCRLVDSTGLSLLVVAIRLRDQNKKEFRIANLSGEVRLLLQITKFDQLCDIHETLESAQG